LQTQTWSRYHLDDPGDLYSQQDGWNVAQRPPNDTGRDTSSTTTASAGPIAPNYLQMRLPGERTDEFVLLRPFVPHSGSSSSSPKKQLNAFMVARNDPAEYGQLVVYSMTEHGPDGSTQRNSEVPGPLSAHENMVSTTRLSQRLAQLNSSSGSSVVTFGNMVIVPIGEGIMYVRPIYVASEAQGSSQQLRIVVVSVGSRVGIGDTYAEALASLFPSAQITTAEEGPGDTPIEDPGDGEVVDELDRTAEDYLIDALRRYDEADDLLRNGGVTALSDYQQAVSEAEELVRRAAEALGAVPPDAPANDAGANDGESD
ncbi:MAG: COG1615 family transporter, partial [Actinobacteria bacterium]|nr:COG1615 family transporter [Actinomycetota bacterium]